MTIIAKATVPGTDVEIRIVQGEALKNYTLHVLAPGFAIDLPGDRLMFDFPNEQEARECANQIWREAVTLRDAAYRAPITVTDGIYSVTYLGGQTVIYKVVESPATGRHYARSLRKGGGWEYAKGRMRDISRRGVKLTAEHAAEYGRLYGVCVQCGRTLTDDESIQRGMGPVCAGKF